MSLSSGGSEIGRQRLGLGVVLHSVAQSSTTEGREDLLGRSLRRLRRKADPAVQTESLAGLADVGSGDPPWWTFRKVTRSVPRWNVRRNHWRYYSHRDFWRFNWETWSIYHSGSQRSETCSELNQLLVFWDNTLDEMVMRIYLSHTHFLFECSLPFWTSKQGRIRTKWEGEKCIVTRSDDDHVRQTCDLPWHHNKPHAKFLKHQATTWQKNKTPNVL